MLLDGRRLYDGGVSEVVPVRLAREMAGEGGVVLAVDCNAGGRWPAADSFVALALRAGLTLLRGRTRGELAGRRPGDRAVHGRVGLDAARARSRTFAQAGRGSGATRRCPSCGGCSAGEARGRRSAASSRPPCWRWSRSAASGREPPPGADRRLDGARRRRAPLRDVGGLRVRYVRAGQRPARSSSLHGFASSIYTWSEVLPALAARARRDRAGPARASAARRAARTFGRRLRRAWLRRADGRPRPRSSPAWSATAWAARSRRVTAARHPDRVERLVLIDAAGFNLAPADRPRLLRLAGRPCRRACWSASAAAAGHRARACARSSTTTTSVTPERVEEYVAPHGPARRVRGLRPLLRSGDALGLPGADPRDTRADARDLGPAGPLDPVSRRRPFVAAIPGARKVVIEGCGHMPQEERPPSREAAAELRADAPWHPAQAATLRRIDGRALNQDSHRRRRGHGGSLPPLDASSVRGSSGETPKARPRRPQR